MHVFSLFRILESIALNTDVVIPSIYMEMVKETIERDGLALARVPERFELDISRYGARDPIGMLQFRAKTIPDASSWRMFESCVTAVYFRLYGHIRQVSFTTETPTAFTLQMGALEKRRINIFDDLLSCLIKQLQASFSEFNVFSSLVLTS
jgi:hypothetical protein